MLMPIVSMNKMAMNESVATTCCFQEVASPTNVYWEVLNGGWIGSGFVEIKSWKKDTKDWADAFVYDIVDSSGNPILGQAGAPNFYLPVKAHGKDYVQVAYLNAPWNAYNAVPANWIDNSVPASPSGLGCIDIGVWFANSGYKRGDNCSHDSPSCKYLDFEIAHLANRHWDSVRKHDTQKTDWAKPHEAQRFHS